MSTDLIVKDGEIVLLNENCRTINEAIIRKWIINEVGRGRDSIDFLSLGMPFHMFEKTNPSKFFNDFLAPGLKIIVTDNPSINLCDVLGLGLYVVTSSAAAFKGVSNYPHALIDNVIIDSGIKKPKLIDEVLREIALSVYTKNKKIAFTKDFKFNVLFNDWVYRDIVANKIANLQSLI